MSVDGVRRDGLLVSSIGSLNSFAETVLTVTSGRTFVLTDLLASVETISVTTASVPVIFLYDFQADGGTLADSVDLKMKLQPPVVPVSAVTGSGVLDQLITNPIVMTNIENGPEFSTEVSVAVIGTTTLFSSGVWVGGVER